MVDENNADNEEHREWLHSLAVSTNLHTVKPVLRDHECMSAIMMSPTEKDAGAHLTHIAPVAGDAEFLPSREICGSNFTKSKKEENITK